VFPLDCLWTIDELRTVELAYGSLALIAGYLPNCFSKGKKDLYELFDPLGLRFDPIWPIWPIWPIRLIRPLWHQGEPRLRAMARGLRRALQTAARGLCQVLDAAAAGGALLAERGGSPRS
jgi:hypothetical protein